jgi:hypothetical protein
MNTLSVYINDQLAFEYDRATTLDEKQLAFLDKMDRDMARSVRIYGELIADPDTKQRASFVTMNLLKALQQENNAKIAVYYAYLAKRLPHLLEVQAKDQGNRINIEFVEEH